MSIFYIIGFLAIFSFIFILSFVRFNKKPLGVFLIITN